MDRMTFNGMKLAPLDEKCLQDFDVSWFPSDVQKTFDSCKPILLEIARQLSELDELVFRTLLSSFALMLKADHEVRQSGAVTRTAGGIINQNPAVVARAYFTEEVKRTCSESFLMPGSAKRLLDRAKL